MNFGKRPKEELYYLVNDPYCINNLATEKAQAQLKLELSKLMETELKAQGDPRQFGNGEIFDGYPFVGDWNNFYERYISGRQTPRTGWVRASDYEKKPLE